MTTMYNEKKKIKRQFLQGRGEKGLARRIFIAFHVFNILIKTLDN